MAVTIRVKRGTDAAIQAGTLAIGELAFATDSKACYTYDGVSKVLVGKAVVDTLANRPTAGMAGRLFLDTGTGYLYVDTGAAWVTVSAGASATTTTVTAGEALSQYDTVYVKAADGKAYKTACNATDAEADVLGIVTQSGGISANSTGSVTILGPVTNGSWNWTANRWVYISATAGGLTQTAPTTDGQYVSPVGIATATNQILVQPTTGWINASTATTSPGRAIALAMIFGG